MHEAETTTDNVIHVPQTSDHHYTIHVAVTRKVKPGCEQIFENIVRRYVRESIQAGGMTGVHMILPSPGSNDREYGILRSFESEAAMKAFYSSEVFARYEQEVEPYVIGPPIRRNLHGLEAFFRFPTVAPPPRWKMAFVTWLGVVPVAYFWSIVLGPYTTTWPRLAGVATVDVFIVLSLVYAVMPQLTAAFRGWLHSQQSGQTMVARS